MDKIDFFLCSIEAMISNWRPILLFQPPHRAHRFESCKRCAWNIFLGSPITEKYLSRTVAWKNPVSRVSLSPSLFLSLVNRGILQQALYKFRLRIEWKMKEWRGNIVTLVQNIVVRHSVRVSCKQTYTSPPNDNGCDGILSSVVFQHRS